MKRRLILHLGLAKTGTSTIQNFLRRNPRKLAAAGIIYPTIEGDLKNTPAIRRHSKVSHHALSQEIRVGRRGGDGPGANPPLWSAVFQQINQSGAHTAVISSEEFGGSVEEYKFDALREKFAEFDVTGLVYLRSQEAWVVSFYAQTVRGEGRRSGPISDFWLYRSNQRLRYSQKMDAIAGSIPLDRLLVGNFDEAARTGLLKDFVELAGLPGDLVSADDELSKKNVSFPHWATLFLLRCNAARLPDKDFIAVRDALGLMASEADLGLRPGLDVASPIERRALRELATRDADRLAEKYGVTLRAETLETAYRPFDEEDFDRIREAVEPAVNQATCQALRQMERQFSAG